MIQGLCTKYIFSRSSHHHIVLNSLTKYWRKKKIKLRFPEKFSNNWVSNTEWDCSTAVLKAGPKQNTHKLERSKPDYVQMMYFKGLLWALRLLLKCCLLSSTDGALTVVDKNASALAGINTTSPTCTSQCKRQHCFLKKGFSLKMVFNEEVKKIVLIFTLILLKFCDRIYTKNYCCSQKYYHRIVWYHIILSFKISFIITQEKAFWPPSCQLNKLLFSWHIIFT